MKDSAARAECRKACSACPHGCSPALGKLGLCRARRGGADGVVPESYGRITSIALDPIEKKPISRWRPRTTVLSLGGYGCSMSCPFCQNDSIAQAGPDDIGWHQVEPAAIVEEALALKDRRCIGIAYTYNEPLVFWEFVRDTARMAHDAGLENVLVSNGMATQEVLEELAPLIDAANIDLKCFTDERYRKLGGNLGAVKRTIEMLAGTSTCHLEVTTLVVPGLSDDDAQMDDMARWLASVGPGIPYHLTRFFPRYRMSDAQPTPISTLRRMAGIAERHLDDVMLGNI